jgi:hypothetical protein
MLIEGKTNLERVRRALDSYVTVLSARALQASDKSMEEYYDPEINHCKELIKSIDINISRITEPEGRYSFAKASEDNGG